MPTAHQGRREEIGMRYIFYVVTGITDTHSGNKIHLLFISMAHLQRSASPMKWPQPQISQNSKGPYML